jgi:hypothetical protein
MTQTQQFMNPYAEQVEEQAPVVNATDEARWGIKPVGRCDYLREIKSGQIHIYSERMAKRGDMVQAYNPTLIERLNFGEDIAGLNAKGVTYEQFVEVGVTVEKLASFGLEPTPAESLLPPVAPPAPKVS